MWCLSQWCSICTLVMMWTVFWCHKLGYLIMPAICDGRSKHWVSKRKLHHDAVAQNVILNQKLSLKVTHPLTIVDRSRAVSLPSLSYLSYQSAFTVVIWPSYCYQFVCVLLLTKLCTLPLLDNRWAVMIVWRNCSVLCCVTYAHWYEQFLQASWFSFCVFVFLLRPVYFLRASFCVLSISSLLLFGCQYLCNQVPGNTRLRNELLCVEWDVKPDTFTNSHRIADFLPLIFQVHQTKEKQVWERRHWRNTILF